jgi:hypothetical protein
MVRRFLSAGDAMWIVTGLARQSPFAPRKTPGLAQPVYGTHRLEFVVVSSTGRMIEEEFKILEGLPRRERKRSPVESLYRSGNASARSLEMALHANVHAEFGTQAGRIHDAAANLFHFGASGPGGSNVLAARSVASLAVDSFGQVAKENRVAAGRFVPNGYSRNSVMAKDTLVRYEAAGPGMSGIGTRRHRPGSAGQPGTLRIPAERQLNERSSGRAMQVGPRMVARPQDVIHFHLFDIRVLSRKTDLPAPLIEFAVAANH